MVKRIKKSPVKPEQRREWLERHELEGESPPRIAEKDHFDVRTVRKQIELAKQEREVREARATVLRNALERHYEDMLRYAESLDSHLVGGPSTESSPDSEFIEAALRQHVPRSPLWNYKTKLQNLPQQLSDQQRQMESFVDRVVKADSNLNKLVRDGLTEVVPRFIEALRHQTELWSNSGPGMSLDVDLSISPIAENMVSFSYGIYIIVDKVNKEATDSYKEILEKAIQNLESQIKDSPELHDLEKTITEIDHTRRKLREELAVIRLRRILPGRCKYCPL